MSGLESGEVARMMLDTNSEQTDCLREGASTLNWKGVGDGLSDEGSTSSANGHVGEGASIAILNCTGSLNKETGKGKETKVTSSSVTVIITASIIVIIIIISIILLHLPCHVAHFTRFTSKDMNHESHNLQVASHTGTCTCSDKLHFYFHLDGDKSCTFVFRVK